MSTEEIMRKYKEKICPSCVHYVDKDYRECNITLDIKQEAKCINYKCKEFCKKARENKGKLKSKKEESKIYVTAKKQSSIMKLK